MITTQSPIVGKGGTVAEVLAYAFPNGDSPPAVRMYLVELKRLCDLVGFDFRILAAQSAHETDNWTSHYWTERRNPAGIGITGDPAQNEESHTWANGTEAAQAHVVHMCAYTGSFHVDSEEIPYDYVELDPRYKAVFDAGFADTVEALGDLGNGRWATDPTYATQIAAKANQIFKEVAPVPTPLPPEVQEVVFGRVPKPPIIELICSKPFEGAGFYRVAPRDNVGVCEHITDGHGSVEFYHAFFSTGGERATDALVDFVIGRDGRIAMLNDWRGTRAPWANGNKLGMEGDGPAFYQEFGVAGIDRRLVSIEHEGTAAEDWPGAMWNAAVALDAWLFDQMGVRFDSYPVHQKYGVVTHMLHSEFTNKGGNALDECPGRYLKRNITAFQSDVRAVMMAHQIVADPAPIDPPKPPIDISPRPFKGFAHGLATRTDQHVGHQLYQYLEREFKVVPGRKAQQRVSPSKDALIVRTIPEGKKVVSAFVARIDDLDWLIDQRGYAWQLNAFTPRVPLPLKARAA